MDIGTIIGAVVSLVGVTVPVAVTALQIVSRRENARIERERIAANAAIESERLKTNALIESEKLKAEALVKATSNEVEAARYRAEAAKLEEERRARVDENTALLIERLLTALIGAQSKTTDITTATNEVAA